MGAHQRVGVFSDEWLTPPELIRALGPFDVDPCSPIKRQWDTARVHYTIEDNGLRREWPGLAWVNPPYSAIATWVKRTADHGNALLLAFARTETKWFHEHVWDRADAVLFFKGRLHFHHPDGRRAEANAGAPSFIAAYGGEAYSRLWKIRDRGALINVSLGRARW